MDIKRISADISVSPQIRATDLAALKAKGFGAVICNRPDGGLFLSIQEPQTILDFFGYMEVGNATGDRAGNPGGG